MMYLSRCIYFYGMYMLEGDIMFFFISIIVSCFAYVTLVIDLYYEVIHDICLLFSVL